MNIVVENNAPCHNFEHQVPEEQYFLIQFKSCIVDLTGRKDF